MKCAIIGGSFFPKDYSVSQEKDCKLLGAWLAENDIHILTGACGGYPYIVSKTAIAKGGRVTGYSPGHDAQEHIDLYEHPLDACTDMVYLDIDYDGAMQRLLMRSLPLMRDCDIAVALQGSWGTLFEMVTGVVCGVSQLVYTGFGGASAIFEQMYALVDETCLYDTGDQVVFTSDMDKIIAQLTRAKAQLKLGKRIELEGAVKHSQRVAPFNRSAEKNNDKLDNG